MVMIGIQLFEGIIGLFRPEEPPDYSITAGQQFMIDSYHFMDQASRDLDELKYRLDELQTSVKNLNVAIDVVDCDVVKGESHTC